MSIVLRFTMSGQTFAYDWAQELTAADTFALDEMGVKVTELDDAITNADAMASGDRAFTQMGLRVICAIAFLAHRRAGNDTAWKDFSRTIAPATLEVLGIDTTPDNRAGRRAAAKRNGKAKPGGKVGAALTEVGAATPGDAGA